MKTLIETGMDSLYIAWTIASKDIADALKNRATLFNIILMMGMVVFFYWVSTVRPWDKRIDVVVYDEGGSGLLVGSASLSDGYEIQFSEASSLEDMEGKLRYQEWGVVVPPDFSQALASEEAPTLTGYILWEFRRKAAELEGKYSDKLSETLERPVRVEIGNNIIIPAPDVKTTMVNDFLFLVMLFVSVLLVPFLMQEEKRTKTMEALLVSPASVGQVVMGKALAGGFYVMLVGGLFFALNWAHVTNWGLALSTFLCCALFCIGVALILGGGIQSPQQLRIWMIPIVILLILPAIFAQEPNLATGLRAVIAWFPTPALMRLFQYSFSSSAPSDQLLLNLAIVLGSTALIYAVVIWQVHRRSNR